MACVMPADAPSSGVEGARDIHLVIPGDPLAVRDGLRRMFDALMSRGVSDADRGTAEIVLAEVLNNIVEHAYAKDGGEIEIFVQVGHDSLTCRVVDTGLPMPDHDLPAGQSPMLAATPMELEDLPEGGFGWFLIRALSRDLIYWREGPRNLLFFRLQTGDAAAARPGAAAPGD